MSSENESPSHGRVSSETVRAATGHSWAEWLEQLDEAGAVDWDHRKIIDYLEREHSGVSGWWRQSIAVGYEQSRGKRAVGQTATGFQVGVQRAVDATPEALWELLVSRPELWLGARASVTFEPGTRFTAPGVSGEIRVVRPNDRLRLTWQPQGWSNPAALQLTILTGKSGTIALHAQLEKLPDAVAREAMRGQWRQALERIAAAVSSRDHSQN
ncbi:SRPBCC domain-containing protein [Actinophytocola sp.]|uniref:SRPBCC family protein n=1 Tax=Actinophytocola sp. TaxID=1872138 RepID=UPI002D806848|nr:SRPBCC domain-containing protein [Actinophytocola sp.]HET9138853.1 SRPBCC domain-containing protein [Actinophytocola sp.]